MPRSYRVLAKRKGKKMPRVPRINIEKALYYVTSRGDNNAEIFKEGSDYAMYLDLLRKCKEQYKFKLFAFCLVPSHLHLLIELAGDTTVSQIMHNLSSNYTKYFNSHHNRTGHLFQERYRMVLVEKEPNLLNMTAYMHLNPKTLNLVKDAADYTYSSLSSYLYYTDKKTKGSLIDMQNEIKEAIGYLKGLNYKDFIGKVSAGDMNDLGKILTKKPILGSDGFVEKVKSHLEREKQKAEELVKASTRNPLATKIFIVTGSIVIIVLTTIAIGLYTRATGIKKTLEKEMQDKDTVLSRKLILEKERIAKGMEERYRADIVSFEAMSKRLEIEKNKTKELEDKLKSEGVKK